MNAAVAFLILEIQTGVVVRSNWPDIATPVPAGSLVKPFTALAYAQQHGFEYPQVACRRCWSGRAHGRVDIEEAIALSCNSYFTELASKLGPTSIGVRFGIPEPSVDPWIAAPPALLKAYVELAARRSEPGVAPILEGMRRSAMRGTGKGIARSDALVKTGTAACVHPKRAPGDGYAVALTPRHAILVQVHSRPGAEAAAEAGRLLAALP